MPLPAIDFDSHPAYAGLGPTSEVLPKDYRRRLDQTTNFIRGYDEFWGYRQRRSSWAHGYDRLVSDGILAFRFPKSLKATVKRLLTGRLDQLAAGAVGSTDEEINGFLRFTTTELKQSQNDDVLKAVHAVEKETAFIELASAYLGMDTFLQAVHLKCEDAGQPERTRKRRVFADIGLADPPSVYMHTDAVCMNLKLIVYLSTVEEVADGPFKYCVGSSAVLGTNMEDYIRRLVTERYCINRDPENRRKLMTLPREYRDRLDFGSDLLEGNPEIGGLLTSEHVYLTSEADAVLFDAAGVHRGAMITKGMRRVLQITLQGHR